MLENTRKSIPKLEGGLTTTGEVRNLSTSARPLVSVVTVCLNSEKHLNQTIQSVLGQIYDNIEYIIVDGGSTDRTIQIIKKYEGDISCWVSEPDEGIFDAMNKGIGMATGQLVGLLNSDDWYHKMALEWVVRESLDKPSSDVFHGDIVLVEDGQNYRRVAPRGKCIVENFQVCVAHPTFFVRREIYREYKYDCRFKISADRDFIMRLYFDGKQFAYINRPITYFRSTGASNQPSFRSVLDRYRIRSRYNKSKAILFLIKEVALFFDELAFSYKKAREK